MGINKKKYWEACFSKYFLFVMICLVVLLYIIVTINNLFFGELNLDEGWYLYSALQLNKGKILYNDFHFSQMPMIPYIYSVLVPLWKNYGITGGRIITLLFGLFGSIILGIIVFRITNKPFKLFAAMTAFLFTACNIYQNYFTLITKTYSLSIFFLLLTFLFLTYIFEKNKYSFIHAFFAGVFMALTIITRTSLFILAPLIITFLFFKKNDKVNKYDWICFGAGGFIAGIIIFLPIILSSLEGFLFGLGVHSKRAPVPVLKQLLFKIGFIARQFRVYLIPLVTLGTLIFYKILFPKKWKKSNYSGLINLVLLSMLLVSLVHVSAPFPYDDYQVPVYPLLILIISSSIWNQVGYIYSKKNMQKIANLLLFVIFIFVSAGSFSSEYAQKWFMVRKDRLWPIIKQNSDIAHIRKVSDWIKSVSSKEDIILTMDTYIAVECGMSVVEGFEMGPFGYFKDISYEEAKKFKVLNKKLLIEKLKNTKAPIAAFSGYAFSMKAPEMDMTPDDEREEIWKIIKSRYKLKKVINDFGQNYTELTLWELRDK